MDFKNLISFVQVAQMNSFSKAAEYLGYSQSTISFQIKQLEQEFNCQLFDRINHTIKLTQKGEELLAYALQMNHLHEQLKDQILQKNQPEGHLKIATSDSLCYELMNQHFQSFHTLYPKITIELIAAGTQNMLSMIDCNEVDAVITLDSHIYSSDYIVYKEKEIEVCFVASPTLVSEDHLTLQQLIQYPFLLTEKNMSYRRIFDEYLALHSIEVKPILECSDAKLLAILASQGSGIALVPKFVANQLLTSKQLKIISVEDYHLKIWQQVIFHKRKWLSNNLKAFIEHFTK